MKKNLLLFIFSVFGFAAFAQYQIGHRTITFNDPSRTGGYGSGGGPGRQIQCEIYYPSATAGNNTSVSPGSFPVIAFGHGFVMTWDAYTNVWENLVPKGYIMVFPRTEGSFSPSHNDFALDLNVCISKMQSLNNDNTSPFYQKVTQKTAIMGHSMGGGATILAASGNTNITTMVALAPAETNPSAISAASGISVPALIFSGVQDGVTPPVDHHIPIFNAVGSSCKTMIGIPGGGHCYFANSNFNCDFGETTSSSGISISRAQQQDIAQDHYGLWLDYHLKSNCTAWEQFLDSISLSTRITPNHLCGITLLSASAGSINNATCGINNGSASVTPSGGVAPYAYSWSNGATTATANGLSAGNYTCTVYDANNCSAVVNVTVSSSGGPTVNTSVSNAACFGETGSIVVTPSGNGPFTIDYQGENPSAVSAGTYSVIVTDNNGCQTTTSYTITQPSALNATGTSNDASNGNSNGSIDLTISGGTAPYTFLWSNTSTAEDQNNLAAGNYSVTISDANGCDTVLNFVINNITGLPTISNDELIVITQGDQVLVMFKNQGIQQLVMMDVSGRLIHQKSSQRSNSLVISTSDFASGTYIIKAIAENGMMVTRKLNLVSLH